MPDVPCDPYLDLTGFNYPLRHLTESLKRKRKIKIVAIGSSSTAGVENTIPYPCRLELALRKRFYGRMIDVLNRGIGGQETPEELSRFESDVIGEAPALVIWQVGTNAVYRKKDYNPSDVAKAIAAGLDWLKGLSMDVVLMDLQYTRMLVEECGNLAPANDMEALISAAADKAEVNLFPRWALMKRWCLQDKVPLADMDDGGKLHMSEWATNCVTNALDSAIASAPPPPVSLVSAVRAHS
jgi:acyl-CoA thioesterase I